MGEKTPTTESISIAETGQDFDGVIDRVSRGGARVRIEENGVPRAAVISMADLRRFQEYQRRREADFAIVDAMRAAFKDVPQEEIEREAAKSVAEARADPRARREAEREQASVASR